MSQNLLAAAIPSNSIVTTRTIKTIIVNRRLSRPGMLGQNLPGLMVVKIEIIKIALRRAAYPNDNPRAPDLSSILSRYATIRKITPKNHVKKAIARSIP